MSRRLEAPLALCFFALASLAWSWPLLLRWNESMAGSLGDPLLLAWTLEWDVHSLSLGHALWDANIFHPSRLALVFSDHLLGQLPLYWIGRHLGLGIVGAYNLTFVAMVTLNGFAAWLLARRACGQAWAALVAGAVYAYAPWRLAHLDHMVFLSTAGYPLALLAWTQAMDETRPAAHRAGAAMATAAALAWQSLCGGYHAVYATALMPALALLAAWRARSVRVGLMAVLPAGVGLGATLPALLPYLEMKRTIGHLSGAHPDWGAGLLSFVMAPPTDCAWGWTARLLGPVTSPEAMLFPGLVALLLGARGVRQVFAGSAPEGDLPTGRAARLLTGLIVLVLAWAAFIQCTGGGVYTLGALKIRAQGTSAPVSLLVMLVLLRVMVDRRLRRRLEYHLAQAPLLPAALAVMALVGVVLSFYGPTAILGKVVPGLGSLRVPARAFLLALLPIAVFASMGLQSMCATLSPARAAAMALLACTLALAEGLGIPMPVGAALDAADRVPRPTALAGSTGDVYRWLATQSPGTVVAELPLGTPALDLWYQFASTQHWQPLVNGSSGYSPRYYAGLTDCLGQFPSASSVAALQELGVQLVVVHEAFLEPSDRSRVESTARLHPLREVARHGNDVVYRLEPRPDTRSEELLGDEIPREGWHIEASVEPGPLRTAPRMLDGDFRTRWATERSQQVGDQVLLDMGRVQTVGAVVLELGSHASDYPRSVRVESSEDGTSWTAAGQSTRDCPPLRACLQRPLDPWVTLQLGTRRARWLRLTLEAPAPAFWCIAELRVHGPPGAARTP